MAVGKGIHSNSEGALGSLGSDVPELPSGQNSSLQPPSPISPWTHGWS